jgi:hypothetical protein
MINGPGSARECGQPHALPLQGRAAAGRVPRAMR